MTGDNRLVQQSEPAPGSARQPVEVLVRFLHDDGEMEGEFDGARRALTELVAVLLDGAAAERVRIGRRCPRCAGTDHGRPVLEAPARAGVHVSLARTRGRAAVAASLTGPIG